MPIADYPYFAVDCPACRRDAKTWERRLDAGTARVLLTQTSEPVRIEILRTLGTHALPGNNYVATLEANQVVLKGRGEGHGVGLCQKGAIAIAIEGKSFTDILAIWFPNTQIRATSGPRSTW
jgi:stage II sporulation protein D